MSQIHGATWALGRTAMMVCQGKAVSNADDLKRIFEETLRRKATEHQERRATAPTAAEPSPADRLQQLSSLLEKRLISQAEHDRKRAEILAQL
jgi:hypothetical protein